uniref:Scavenger receptor class F member 2 n=1 Tax=Magallana gigas TaxID=29159 RepID=A0A8W8NV84_MAGGI
MDYNTCLLIYLAGFSVSLSYDDLSYNKVSTQSHTYSGTYMYYSAMDAVDRNIATCMRTKDIGVNSPDRTVWWKVDLGGVYNIYSINILFKNYDGRESRQRELCEVIVYGCKRSGMYGDNCDKYCPTNCKDHKCHIHNGTCYACQPGWMGTTCNTKCRDGMYGFNCSHQCSSHCRDRSVCSHVTGQCDRGCDAGWTGLFCYNECINGTYDCVNNCSGHCQNNYSCNKQTGHCDTGCNLGYTNNY